KNLKGVKKKKKGDLNRFHLLAIMNSATVNIGVPGLWTVFTLGGVGSKVATASELSSPLANQSLLLLLVLANLTDAADAPNPYRQAIMSFKNTQDSSPFPSSIPHAFQINFNSLYMALCEQQTSDQATLLLYTLLHQNSNIRTYMLARTDMENLVLPILEILYHVEERNSHHVYMALIILLILTEDDGFNRSIHEVKKYLHCFSFFLKSIYFLLIKNKKYFSRGDIYTHGKYIKMAYKNTKWYISIKMVYNIASLLYSLNQELSILYADQFHCPISKYACCGNTCLWLRKKNVAISFSRGSSRLRDRIFVPFIGRWILYH
ncbi:hypothetical protein FD754_001391, partial [Muntiacus muntjak]